MTSNVLVLHSSDEAYGSDRMCAEFVRNLVERGCRVTLGLPDDSEPGWLSGQVASAHPSVTIVRLPLAVARRKAFSPRGIIGWAMDAIRAERTLRRLIRAQKIDVLYLNSLALIAQVVDIRLAPLRILHCHEIATTPPIRLVQRLSGHLVDQVICVSQAVADAIPSGRVLVCRNGIADSSAAVAKASSGSLRVGFVGRLSRFKGIERFLEVASLVDRHDVSFEVTGGPIPGEDRYLQMVQRASNEGLTYRGEVEDTSPIFAELDVLVVPSATPDPYPTVVLEGLRGGCIVLATSLGGAAEAFGADAGFVVDPADASSIAQLIEDLAQDPDRVANMQSAARATYVGQHRVDAFDKRFGLALDECGVSRLGSERPATDHREQHST